MKIGVVDVGGGLRGIFGAGVLDYCLDHGIRFDVGVGVSAGSANLASYAAEQARRNYTFYTEYAFRKQYMSMDNFLHKHSFVDMEYVYGTLCRADGENPLDYLSLRDNPMELYVVAADVHTGEPIYFDKQNIQQDVYDVFKASSSIPFVCPPYEIQGVPYYDGALADPVPVEKAFALGCDRVVLILTKPESLRLRSRKEEVLAALIRKQYPIAAKNLRQRAVRYNKSVEAAQAYAKQGKVLIVSPDDTCGVDTLKKDRAALEKLYQKGYASGTDIACFLA